MLHYLTKSVIICIYFQEDKKNLKIWIKTGSKFGDILESLNFTDFGFLFLLLNKKENTGNRHKKHI